MSTEGQDQIRTARRLVALHAASEARQLLRAPGSRKAVAVAIAEEYSRVRHWATDQDHPVLVDAVRLMLDLTAAPELDVWALAMSLHRIAELREVLDAPTDRLLERGHYLIDRLYQLRAADARASQVGCDRVWDALERTGAKSLELAAIGRVLQLRGVDLYASHRETAKTGCAP